MAFRCRVVVVVSFCHSLYRRHPCTPAQPRPPPLSIVAAPPARHQTPPPPMGGARTRVSCLCRPRPPSVSRLSSDDVLTPLPGAVPTHPAPRPRQKRRGHHGERETSDNSEGRGQKRGDVRRVSWVRGVKVTSAKDKRQKLLLRRPGWAGGPVLWITQNWHKQCQNETNVQNTRQDEPMGRGGGGAR